MSFINPARFTTRPEITGTFGVVASTHWLATAVGMGILERDGNAFDAGVATAFTLQAVGKGQMAGFTYTVTHANAKATTAVPTGWTTSTVCWVTKKNGQC